MNERDQGLAVIRAYHHGRVVTAGSLAASYLRSSFVAGQAMDLAERLRGQGSPVSGERVQLLASTVGLSPLELRSIVLPTLQTCGVVDFSRDGDRIVGVEEYVGVSAPFLVQTARVFEALGPGAAERVLVLSGQLAAHAPLAESNHLEALAEAGFTDEEVAEGVRAAAAVRLVQRIDAPFGESIIFNEHVWSTGVVEAAGFLRSLPSSERAVLLGVCTQASSRPGLALQDFSGVGAAPVISRARRVGLLDTVAVKSRSGARQTYVFSPLIERELSLRHATDALHERKLLVAHIMFGHQFGQGATGKIRDPVVLVDRLLARGQVGPATAITNDYLLLEAHGIVRVEPTSSGMSMLKLVKDDVVRDGLALLTRTLGARDSVQAPGAIEGLWLPSSVDTPEADRSAIVEDDGEADELFKSVLSRLHEEAGKVIRDEQF